MGAALALAGLGLQVAGGLQQAAAAKQEAKNQQAMMNYNARVKEEEAKAAEAKAVFDSQRQAEAAERQQSRLQAELGASGAIPTAGSPLLIQAKQKAESDLDNLMIGYEGITTAKQLRQGAEADRTQGKMYRQAGNNAAMGSYLNTGATVLGGLYKIKKGKDLY